MDISNAALHSSVGNGRGTNLPASWLCGTLPQHAGVMLLSADGLGVRVTHSIRPLRPIVSSLFPHGESHD